jgi:hypothetical protein
MRISLRAGLLVPVLALLASSLTAQAVLRPGTTAQGELKSGDLKLDDDTYADLWRFTGAAGQRVTVTMRSAAFDTYLVVGYYDDAGNFKSVDSDDDGAGGTDSRVVLRLARDGEFIARANTLHKGETGSYTLELEVGAAPAAPAAAGSARAGGYPEIAIGQVVRGALEGGDEVLADDSFADTYRFSGAAGQRLVVTLKSPDFDAYLSIGRMDNGSYAELEADDDGGGGTDAILELSLPATAEYVVRANTLSDGETGSYELLVREAGGPQARAVAGGDSLVSVRPGARMPLVLGQALSGTLGPGDEKLSDDSFADIWVYQGRKGETLTMIQRSTAHDAYLTAGPVSNGRWVWSESNNNDAGGTDAKLVVTLKADGEYWVRPNALNKGTGPYTLLVTSDRVPSAAPTPAPVASPTPRPSQAQPPMPSAGPLQQGITPGQASAGGGAPAPPRPAAGPPRVPIQVGQTVRGELTPADEFNFDSTYVDTYVVRGTRGQRLDIIMMSPAFGSYVLFGRAPAPGVTFSSIETKGAVRGAEARMTVTVPDDGEYWVRANSFGKTTGSYVLSLEASR